MMNWLWTANGRRWIYGVALAVIAILVAYNVIEDDQSGVWVALITALLAAAPVTALAHVTPDAPSPASPHEGVGDSGDWDSPTKTPPTDEAEGV